MQIPEDQMEQIYIRLSSLIQHQVSMQIPQEQIEQIVDAVVKEVTEEMRRDLALFKQELLHDLLQLATSSSPSDQHVTPTSPIGQKKKSLKDWW